MGQSLVYGLAEDKMFFKQLEGRNCWCFAEAQAYPPPPF